MRIKPLALLVAATLLSGASATASVVVYTDDVALQQNQQEKQYFSQSGLSGEKSEVVPGAGADMPLPLVAQLIIPSSWKIESSGNFDNSVVSWQGGLVWPQIIRDIAQREQLFVSLDWIKKIASIHVPGERAQLAMNAQNNAQERLGEQKASIEASESEKLDKRVQAVTRANNDRAQLDLLLSRSRESQQANQAFIEKLDQRNQRAEDDNKTLRDMLEKERQARIALEERYKVITPGLTDGAPAPDATELFAEHNSRWVLPFDPSFDYFIKGGHSDLIEMGTPATYLAKAGSIEDVVTAWCLQIGCIVEYRAGIQHYNQYEVEFKGSFLQATTDLIKIFKSSQRPLDVDFYPEVKDSKTGRKGLVIISDLNYSKSR